MMRILRTISDSIERIQGGWKMYTAENIRKNRQLYIPIWATMTVDCGGGGPSTLEQLNSQRRTQCMFTFLRLC
jgi:hypothetical protein